MENTPNYDFNNTFSDIDKINTLSPLICKEINILSGASRAFIDFAYELETCTDTKLRAAKAKAYIEKNKGMTEVTYSHLIRFLQDMNLVPLTVWRQLYLLERSIPPRFGSSYTWVQRLKMFANTYVRECAVNDRGYYNGFKLLFRKGNAKNPTNHHKLVYGQGKWGADFYFFDNNLPGTANYQKMVSVELKHSSTNLNYEINKYKDDKYLYNAKYLILAMADGSYYMIDYTNAIPKADILLDKSGAPLKENDIFSI